MFFRRPLLINQLSFDASTALARLSGIEGISRAILVGVIPVLALNTFGSKENIASIYFGSTLFTLIFTLNLPFLKSILYRRGLITLSTLLLLLSILFFYSEIRVLFAIGIGIRAAGASMFSVILSLYIMDYVGKRELTRNESRRMLYIGVAWLIGPSLGSWFLDQGQMLLVYAIAGISTIWVLIYFWRIRLGDDDVIKASRSEVKTPLRSVIRYFSQSRLRIAYLITFSRACYWVILFVYGPIYVIEAGLPTWVGGVLLSGVSGLLLLSPIVQRLTERFGTRQVLIACSLLIGFSSTILGLIGDAKPVGILFFVIGAFGGVGMDILVNIPFMRLVKLRERTEMTTVFTTWRESSSLITQALVFLTLLVAPFWVFYFILALIQFSSAIATSYLPKRL